MKFDEENIERWMFEFYEGTLSEEEKKALLQYLDKHPEYQADFSSWELAKVTEPIPVSVPFEDTLMQPAGAKPWFLSNLKHLMYFIAASLVVIGIYHILTKDQPVKKNRAPQITPVILSPVRTKDSSIQIPFLPKISRLIRPEINPNDKTRNEKITIVKADTAVLLLPTPPVLIADTLKTSIETGVSKSKEEAVKDSAQVNPLPSSGKRFKKKKNVDLKLKNVPIEN